MTRATFSRLLSGVGLGLAIGACWFACAEVKSLDGKRATTVSSRATDGIADPPMSADWSRLEVGVDLAWFDELKAAAARGEYDRPCTPEEHDPTKWHPLVNEEKKCHYNHQHGDDPNLLNDVFGEPGAWFGKPGQSVSYPWQTFKIPAGTVDPMITPEQAGTALENQHGHEMYFWVVRRDQPCDLDGYCVKDFRIQFHGDTTFSHAETRYHSISAEVRACENVDDPSTCGIIRTGGWMDYRRLFALPFGSIVRGHDCGNLPNDPAFAPFFVSLPADELFGDASVHDGLLDEFRCHQVLPSALLQYEPRVTDDTALAEWWGHGATDFRFQMFVFDPISNTVETARGSGKLKENFNCAQGDPSCRWNNSIFTASLGYILPLPPAVIGELTGPKFTQMSLADKRYFTRWGERNPTCTAVGLDCIPVEYDHLPTKQPLGQQLEGFVHHRCIECAKVDHDLTPPGRPSWIDWFYRMREEHVH